MSLQNLPTTLGCRAQAIAVLLKDRARLEQERAAFASKRQVYKGFSREQLSSGVAPRTHSADSMESFSGGTSSYNRQQVPPLAPFAHCCLSSYLMSCRINMSASSKQHTDNTHHKKTQCTTDLLLLLGFSRLG